GPATRQREARRAAAPLARRLVDACRADRVALFQPRRRVEPADVRDLSQPARDAAARRTRHALPLLEPGRALAAAAAPDAARAALAGSRVASHHGRARDRRIRRA